MWAAGHDSLLKVLMMWEEEELEPDLYQTHRKVGFGFSCELETDGGNIGGNTDVKESSFHPLKCVKLAFIQGRSFVLLCGSSVTQSRACGAT